RYGYLLLSVRLPHRSPLFPYTTLFRSVRVSGHDIIRNFRAARSLIGLVPQELTVESFESVLDTVTFSRGLFGQPPNPAHIEKVLDRKSTRLNSSHVKISYAVFCLKKKK